MAKSFIAELVPVPHGGHYVVVPSAVAAAVGLRHGRRVRGTVRLRPSMKREHVKSLLGSKKADTRSRRLEKILAGLGASAAGGRK